MSIYWPGTGVQIVRNTNPFGDEWFTLEKDGLVLAEIDSRDITSQRAFGAFAQQVGAALGRDSEKRHEAEETKGRSASKAR